MDIKRTIGLTFPTRQMSLRERQLLPIKHGFLLSGSLTLFLLILIAAGIVHAETYVIDGSKGKTKLEAIVAMAQNPKAKVERCKFTEKQDSNEGAVVCRAVELSPRGTLRLQK